MVRQIILSKEESNKIKEINKLKNKLQNESISTGELLIYISLVLTFVLLVLEFVQYIYHARVLQYVMFGIYPLTFILFISGIVVTAREGYVYLN